MTISVYADVICPWSYIGKRRIEAALALLDGQHSARVAWRSFQLGPDLSSIPGPTAVAQILRWRGEHDGTAHIARIRALGAAEGLDLNLQIARPVNTLDAHRLLHLAARSGVADAMWERLLRAYHTQGLNIADHSVLENLALEVGLDSHDIEAVLGSDLYAEAVRRDQHDAATRGVGGVPMLVVGEDAPISAVMTVETLASLFAVGPAL